MRTLNELPAEAIIAVDDLPAVHVPRPSIDELIRAGFAPIIREGAGEEEVAIRTFKVLAALEGALPHAGETTQTLADEFEQNIVRTMADDAARARTLAVQSGRLRASTSNRA